MQEPGIDQRGDDVGHAAGRVEVVHVARAVRVDPRDQRHHAGKPVEILPIDDDARGARHGRDVDRVVGRAAGGEQADDGVDDRPLVDAAPERAVIVAVPADLGEPVDRRTRHRLPQPRAGIDEGGAGHVQAHHVHHHLVGIGGAVEGAGSGPVIGGGLALQQFRAADLALGIELPDALLLLVGEPRGHGAGRNQDHRQVAEAERADDEAGHDLVADAQQRRALEHAVAERDRSGEGDGIAGEQRQLHAALALGDAVAHGGRAAGHLGRRTHFAGEQLDLLGIAPVGLMRREHVVVGGDDADIHGTARDDRRLVLAGRREAVGEVAAGEHRAVHARLALAFDQVEIGAAAVAGARDDALGDRGDLGMKLRHGSFASFGCRRHGQARKNGACAPLNMERLQTGSRP